MFILNLRTDAPACLHDDIEDTDKLLWPPTEEVAAENLQVPLILLHRPSVNRLRC